VVGLNESLPGRIFISYRRQETAWPAGRLYDVFVEHFSAEEVFKDVDNIEPGEHFVERITAAVESCDVLLALIGPRWLTMIDEKGQRRLDDPEDYVRLEIETALTRTGTIRVIPILVDEAKMPHADELPPTLRPLVYRHAVEINPSKFDTKGLISMVQKALAALKGSDTATRSAAPPSTARPDRSNQQVAGPDVEQLYDQALAALWTEQWDNAVDRLGQVLSHQPDYPEAAAKLESALRQQELASHYAQASAAADAGNWEQAVAKYTVIVNAEPDYRDAKTRLAKARQQQQLAGLLTEAHRLHRARQWAAVIKVGEQLQAIDPSSAEADGLMTSARAQLAAEQRAAAARRELEQLAALFCQAERTPPAQLPPEPHARREYLMRLRGQLSVRKLPSESQMELFAELSKLLEVETDDQDRGYLMHLLAKLGSRRDATHLMSVAVDDVLSRNRR
jgi:tetratricopeptide (TPR) repeat protein